MAETAERSECVIILVVAFAGFASTGGRVAKPGLDCAIIIRVIRGKAAGGVSRVTDAKVV